MWKRWTWSRYMQMKHRTLQEARQLKNRWMERETEGTQDKKYICDGRGRLINN